MIIRIMNAEKPAKSHPSKGLISQMDNEPSATQTDRVRVPKNSSGFVASIFSLSETLKDSPTLQAIFHKRLKLGFDVGFCACTNNCFYSASIIEDHYRWDTHDSKTAGHSHVFVNIHLSKRYFS
jgi:hypothetical protein